MGENAEFRRRLFGLDESHHPKAAKLARWGEWFFRRCANNVRDNGTQLVISGPPGTGKSRVARRVWGQIQAWGVDICLSAGWRGKHPMPVVVDWPDMAEADREWDFEALVDEIRASSVVVLDDVGSEADRYRSGSGAARLRRVLSLCESKWLLVTTNLSKPEMAETYDTRVLDRLSAAHWCELQGLPSYRPKIRKGRTVG